MEEALGAQKTNAEPREGGAGAHWESTDKSRDSQWWLSAQEPGPGKALTSGLVHGDKVHHTCCVGTGGPHRAVACWGLCSQHVCIVRLESTHSRN